MKRRQKHLGKGSLCSVLVKNLHPKNIIAAAFPNTTAQDHLNDHTAFKQASACHQGGHVTQNAIYFLTPSIPNAEVWAVIGFTRVVEECPEDRVFCATPPPSPTNAVVHQEATELPQEVLHRTGDLNEDISLILQLGLQVDDDREHRPSCTSLHR